VNINHQTSADAFKNINLGLSFLLELAMLVGFGYWGFHGDKSVWLKWTLGIGLPLVVMVLWGLWLAPNAGHRLNLTGGAALSSILFLLSAMALFNAQQPLLATVFTLIIIANRALMLVWKQW